jgi:hypothetical protein
MCFSRKQGQNQQCVTARPDIVQDSPHCAFLTDVKTCLDPSGFIGTISYHTIGKRRTEPLLPIRHKRACVPKTSPCGASSLMEIWAYAATEVPFWNRLNSTQCFSDRTLPLWLSFTCYRQEGTIV